jgi:citrate lyase subunit beta/citryl-CoA lyase
VNNLHTDWGAEDVAFAAGSGADAVLLPKVESADDVREAQRLLAQHGAPPGLDVWCMIETPLGVLNVAEICRSVTQQQGVGGANPLRSGPPTQGGGERPT